MRRWALLRSRAVDDLVVAVVGAVVGDVEGVDPQRFGSGTGVCEHEYAEADQQARFGQVTITPCWPGRRR